MRDTFHIMFQSPRNCDVFDDCKIELDTVGKNSGLFGYLPDLLFILNDCQDAVSGLQSGNKSSEPEVRKGIGDEHE